MTNERQKVIAYFVATQLNNMFTYIYFYFFYFIKSYTFVYQLKTLN